MLMPWGCAPILVGKRVFLAGACTDDMAKRKKAAAKKKANGNGANLGFEATLWLAADKMRNNMDAAEYKHVVLGLIFLKYISDGWGSGWGLGPGGPGLLESSKLLRSF